MNLWQIREEKLIKEKIHCNETLFHTANGYIGIRGNFEEGVAPGIPTTQGTYINGFYESYEMHYAEKYHGDADFAQTIINVTDAQKIELWLDDEKFSLFQGTVLNYERTLDMKEGIVTRLIDWQSPKGKRIKLTIQRLASFIQKELFIIRYSIESVNFQGNVRLKSSLINRGPASEPESADMRIGRADTLFLSTKEVFEKDNIGYVISNTIKSKLDLVCSVAHHVSKQAKKDTVLKEREIIFDYQFPLMPNEQVEFEKYVVYSDSRRHKNAQEESTKIIKKAITDRFAFYAKEQQKCLKSFWEQADINIEGDDSNQTAIRYNLYSLFQSVGRDIYSSISAKGLAGPGYEGHYFWDTEIYIIPFFLFSHPELAKNLLLFRYHTLPAARERAKQMGYQKGAMIPWRTINGSECGSYYPSGAAECHINPDLANAIILYYQVTNDLDFLADFGAEILFETARVMFENGCFRSDGLFCIFSVTGPDEYQLMVNNNYYTNLMTKYHFAMCKEVWHILKTQKPESLQKLISKINLHENEINDFARAADKMYLPFDDRLKIYAQDDSFLQKKLWDFANTPKENYPLLLHYHPLTLNRYQVCKQADTILGHMLREEEAPFEAIKNGYYYYEKITTHDSSLSHCVFSIMACRVGDKEKAFDYFQQTARLDLDDIHHNTYYGIHTACMAGAWMCIVYGFAGVRVIKNELHLRPHLPKQWKKMEFVLHFKGRKLLISMTHEKTTINLVVGNPLSIFMNDLPVELTNKN